MDGQHAGQSHPGSRPPDFGDSMQAGLMGMVIFFIVFTTAVVIARVVMQLWVHRRLYWDDVWLLLSLIVSDALLGLNIYGINQGLGLHIDRVASTDPHPPSKFLDLWKVGLVNSILSYIILFTCKLSLLTLYRRLFWIARWFRVSWHLNLAFIILWVVASVLIACLQCIPITFTWDRIYLWMHMRPPHEVHGHCISQNWVIVLSSLSLASDVGIWAMPMAALVKLQMGVRRKLELGGLLSLGAGAVACGLGKIITSKQSLTSTDLSWENSSIMVWATLEENLAILCACIPVVVGCARSLRATYSTPRPSRATPASAYSGVSGSAGSKAGKAWGHRVRESVTGLREGKGSEDVGGDEGEDVELGELRGPRVDGSWGNVNGSRDDWGRERGMGRGEWV